LLDASLKIEQSMGRKRTHPKGPRIIDIDLLLYGDQVVNEPGLVIPHPAMHERRFVLEPLAEIAPEIPHPVINESVSRILAALPITRPVVRRLPARE
jgi:2-amino-4-hydroxy-6-hydroxymethyldihydropteridine diphosphokinase